MAGIVRGPVCPRARGRSSLTRAAISRAAPSAWTGRWGDSVHLDRPQGCKAVLIQVWVIPSRGSCCAGSLSGSIPPAPIHRLAESSTSDLLPAFTRSSYPPVNMSSQAKSVRQSQENEDRRKRQNEETDTWCDCDRGCGACGRGGCSERCKCLRPNQRAGSNRHPEAMACIQADAHVGGRGRKRRAAS